MSARLNRSATGAGPVVARGAGPPGTVVAAGGRADFDTGNSRGIGATKFGTAVEPDGRHRGNRAALRGRAWNAGPLLSFSPAATLPYGASASYVQSFGER
ncbi:hypothetical protein GCM10027187_01490 [Streptosporangium sandarakinum]